MSSDILLFSRKYLDQGPSLDDSDRFRRRLYAFYGGFSDHVSYLTLAHEIVKQTGADFPGISSGYPSFEKFFKNVPIRDILDSLSIIYDHLKSLRGAALAAEQWKADVSRAIAEENLKYQVNDTCRIRRLIDAEFDRNSVSALACLTTPRYQAVSTALQSAHANLTGTHPNYKASIRDCFEAAETLVKLICDTSSALDSALAEKRLRPIIDKIYCVDKMAASTAGRMISSFGSWVNAAHPFRHGHNTELPVVVPEDLGVLLISQGTSYIRWLVDVDKQK